MLNTVVNINAEISKIDHYRKLLDDATKGGIADGTKVEMEQRDLINISARLYDLREFYLRADVSIPFPVRDD